MGDSLLRTSPSWMQVRNETDGWGSGKSRSFVGLTKKSPCSKYVRWLALLGGEDGRHVAQVCKHEGPCISTNESK